MILFFVGFFVILLMIALIVVTTYSEYRYISKKQIIIHTFRKFLLKLGKIKPVYCKNCKYLNTASSTTHYYKCQIPFSKSKNNSYEPDEVKLFPYIRDKNEFNTCIDYEKNNEYINK